MLPWDIKLVTLRCKLKSRPGLALGPLGAPEYESRVNSRSRVPLPTFLCRSDHPECRGREGDAAASDLQIKGGGARQGSADGKAAGLHLGQGGEGRLVEVGAHRSTACDEKS